MHRLSRATLCLLLALMICGAWTPSAFAFVPKTARTPLDQKEFFKPDLHLNTANAALDDVDEALPNKAAWGRFFSEYGGGFRVWIDPRSGAPTNIMGHVALLPGRGIDNQLTLQKLEKLLGRRVTQVDSSVVSDVVRKFVVKNFDVLAVDPAQLGSIRADKINDEIWQISIPQQVNGIPVRWGRLAATINNGNLVLIGTETWGKVSVDLHPAISAEDAMQIGYEFAAGQKPSDSLWLKPRLEIVPFAPANLQSGEGYGGPIGQGYGHRLVWVFGFTREGDPGSWQATIDAHTAEMLEFKDVNHYAKKKISGGIYPVTNTEVCPDAARCGSMQPGSPMPWANTGLPAPNDFANSAGLYEYTSGNTTTTLAGRYVSISDNCGSVNESSANGTLDLGGTNGQHDCATAGSSLGDTASSRSAFYELNKLAELARGWLPNNTWLQSQLTTNVNINDTCNAFYSTSNGSINFYKSGGGCRNTGEIAAIFDHEWGHALDDNDTNGFLSTTSESYADIAAIYRLQQSCVGYGFWWTADQSCGSTLDGTGFNGDDGQLTPHCELNCSGVRGADYLGHAGGVPDTPANFSCSACDSGSGPCGREVHCDAMPATEAAWDFAARDLQAAPFNYDSATAFIIANKLYYQGSGNIGSWHACSCPSSSDGCGATNAYTQWLAADDDNGNVNDGTPHMTALYAAFNRHGLACATPGPTNGGCAGRPTNAPNLTVAPGSNQVVLNWGAVAGATKYWVLRAEGFAGCNFSKALIATVTGTTYTDTNVANGSTYSYNVVAVGSSDACFGPASTCAQATPQPCAGAISLDQSVYSCQDVVGISLVDSDLSGVGTYVVSISSGIEPTPENVTLTENPPGSGQFSGTFPTTAAPSVNGDGAISVANADTITVTYVDASYCGTPNLPVTASAPIDCVGPTITSVASQNVSGNSAQIVWNTDEVADSRVIYDTAFPPSASSAAGSALVLGHQVSLAGLTPCTTYYYYVTSTDPAGNSTADTNGGAYYTLRTGTNTNPTYTYPGPAVPIPDNTPSGASATINVPYYEFLTSLTVTVNITHTYDGDIALTLIAPDGRTVPLSTRRGSSGDNFANTIFDDAAATAIASGTAPFTGSFRPESPLGVLAGMPSYGDWTLKVVDSASNDIGSIVSWSLTLNFPPAPCGAQISLDANVYSCNSTGTITVKDTNVAGPTVTIAATSATEPGGETITLTRLAAPQDTWFQGTLPFTSAAATNGDGLLSMAHNDTATVTYLDADDGQGNLNVSVTDTATTDCAAPAISNVSSSNVTGNSAAINWTTSESSTSVVHYGLAIPPGLTTSNGSLVTTHAISLSGLSPCSDYYYSVESADTFGNTVVDTNGGNYYRFTTPQNTAASYASTDTPLAIPDNNTTGATSTINVVDVDLITDLNVLVNITHTFDGDISLSLIAPNGTSIALSNKRGSSGDNYTNTSFDDSATATIASGTAPFTGSFKPEAPLNIVNGLSAQGAWKLKVVDSASSDVGTIQNWSLQFTYQPRSCGAAAAYLSSTTTDSCSGGGSGSGNGSVERSEEIVMPVTIRNTGTVTLTGVSALLTTTTPEVFITRTTATYSNIPAGASSTSNAPHFAYTVGTGVPCGSDIAFNLSIQTNEGTFNSSFTIKVGRRASGNNSYPSTDVPKPIPDNNTAGVTSIVNVADTNVVQGVRVKVNITHTFDGDIALTLVGPNGTSVSLSNKRGSSGDNYTNTTFDDTAATAISSGSPPFTGTFRPESPLGVFNGIPANGTWSLKVVDSASSDLGTITGWTLELTTDAGWACTDCAPLAPVGEPIQQRWIGKTAQQWEAVTGGTLYKLYRGDDSTLASLITPAVDSCLKLSVSATSTGAVLTESPAPGAVYWYLVRAANNGGEGPAGSATTGPRTHNSSGACP